MKKVTNKERWIEKIENKKRNNINSISYNDGVTL